MYFGAEDIGENILREVKVSSPPAEEVIELDYFKNYAKIPKTVKVDDELAMHMIINARRVTEKYLNEAFITQTLIAYWDQYGKQVDLPRGPHQSITTVETIYQGTTTTLTANTDYYTGGEDWLSIYPNSVYRGSVGKLNYHLRVTYVAGYGTDREDVPEEYYDIICAQAAIDYYRGEASRQLSGEVIRKSGIIRKRANWF